MRPRILVGLAIAGGYLGFLTHATAGAQCPARELGPCARVHAMLARRFVPEPATVVQPMTARTAADADAFAARLVTVPSHS
jgi:hypothetical protein